MQKKFESGTFLPDSLISCRTLYKANGFSNDDMSRPIIGVCNSFTDIVPGHRHLKELAEQVKYGVYRAGRHAGRVRLYCRVRRCLHHPQRCPLLSAIPRACGRQH